MKASILALPGDGIGPEIVAAAKRVLAAVGERFGHEFTVSDALIGGAAIDAVGTPLPEPTAEAALAADAVLLGAVGGPKWDDAPVRPEAALLGIRKRLGLYANLRPARLYPALAGASALRPDILARGIDLVIVRELTGGIYFGERGYRGGKFGREAFDTECYSEIEIERVARIAYELAEKRGHRLCLVDKANVLTSSALWRKVVTDINEDYPTVAVDCMYVDNAFGATAAGMYEAIHGSAPDIAGQGKANPVGTILSAAMMLRHSFDLGAEAAAVENAVAKVIAEGKGTPDIGGALTTDEMTEAVIAALTEE